MELAILIAAGVGIAGIIFGFIIGRSTAGGALKQENIELKAKLEAEENNLAKFENIANKVIAEQAAKSNEEIRKTLDPFQKNLETFRTRVEDLNTESAKGRQVLLEHIKELSTLSDQLSDETENLTNALRSDKKMQGDWGEVILEKVLEQSGLEKGREYEMQKSIKSDDGRHKRPDVIIHLPDKKNVIIDSKVSLNAYTEYVNALDEGGDEADAAGHLKSHLKAIDNHISQLSSQEYEKLPGINSLEYTLLFFPLEPALVVAQKEDTTLVERALAKKIILVTPSTLLMTLKVIHNLWRNEHRVQNAEAIAREGGRLYDKFHGFITDMNNIGESLSKAQQSFQGAKNKLYEGSGDLLGRAKKMGKSQAKLAAGNSGSLDKAGNSKSSGKTDAKDNSSIIDSVENMKDLGADTKKQLPKD